ncbi:electron transfer flavoprotein subunit beta/FixA family protein [Chloroflexota bacterium]
MDIIVFIKQIIDPEMPTAKFKVDTGAKKVIPPEGMPLVINPFDAQAVEAALRLKETQGAKITAVCMGDDSAKDVVKHVVSMGADEGILLSDAAFDGSDSLSTAYILAKAVEKIGAYDLILCGRQAADWDAGQVGSILAENLGIPVITLAKSVEAADGNVKVERVVLDGLEIIEATLPALVTVSNEIGQARLPTGKGIIMAARKQIPAWTAGDLGCDASLIGSGAAKSELLSLTIPSRARKGEIVEGESIDEAAGNLALKLREMKAI